MKTRGAYPVHNCDASSTLVPYFSVAKLTIHNNNFKIISLDGSLNCRCSWTMMEPLGTKYERYMGSFVCLFF